MKPGFVVASNGARPLVSIVIPVFNAGRYLRKALGSATAQTYPAVEVILVDDGSDDLTTLAIVAEAAEVDGVSVRRTAREGPARARNLAIEHARGAYILPLDADDYLDPLYLERTVPVLEGDATLGVAYTWVGLVGRHHGVWRTGSFTVPELLVRNTIHVTSLYRRELWVDVGGYDPTFTEAFEDWDFWLSAARRGWRGTCVPEVLAYYRRLPSGREVVTRRSDVRGTLIRRLVAKHRDAFEGALEDTVVALHERAEWAGNALERLYHLPPIRALRWARQRSRRPPQV
jgi:glycosyltransferase involved in cell wall biosynthesis